MRTQSKVMIQKKYQPVQLSDIALYRFKIIEKYKKLRIKGLSEQEALEILEVKRSTFFCWLKKYNQKTTELENKSRRPFNLRETKIITHELVSHIFKIRQENPMYGKEKIRILLQKENIIVSSSTVGRCLKQLFARDKIIKVPLLKGKHANHLRRNKRIHAQRLRKEKAEKIGELIQIDHMVLNLYNGLRIKEFRATCPITRISTSRIYSSATAKNAKEFLKHVMFEFDFEIKSIQVDGGSEFMAEFEEYCKELGIKLYVLPPRSPKMNGKVERANETYRYEFWNIYEIPDTIEEARKLLKEYEYKYNCERPHQSLEYLTPMEYYYTIKENVA